jgi:D-alanine transaminase
MKNSQINGYLDGRYGLLTELNVSVMDRGFLFGDGCYEVIPVYDKNIFLLEPHLDRLIGNLVKIQLPFPDGKEKLSEILNTMVSCSDLKNSYLYLQITRGSYEKRFHEFPQHTKATVFAYIAPFNPPDVESASKDLNVVFLEDIRWSRCDIKSISLLGNVLLREEAASNGAGEAILMRNGFVTEGSTSNVFIVRDGVIKTAPLSQFILPGITRQVVIHLSHALGLPCIEETFTEEETRSADEIWITSSTREVMLVVSFDNVPMKISRADSLWQKVFLAYSNIRNDTTFHLNHYDRTSS